MLAQLAQQAKPGGGKGKSGKVIVSETPQLGEEILSAVRRLKGHRDEIQKLESAIQQQSQSYRQYLPGKREAVVDGGSSSGANYFDRSMQNLKSSNSFSPVDAANELTISDAKCVVCQFLVQQTQGVTSGTPLTTGGATAGGKRAAALAAVAAADAADAAPAASFLELEEEMQFDLEDGESFLELQASTESMAAAGIEAMMDAEMESTVALAAAAETFMAAADAAMEHGSAAAAVDAHYGRRAVPARSAYANPPLRNFAPVTYPEQLNDHGFEDVTRNRAADVLQYRPRQARFMREPYPAAVAKWEETRANYQKLYGTVYRSLESLCSKKMPLAYAAYCQELLKDYRYIAQGIIYGDRAQSICMNANWCDGKSYIRKAVHAYFVRENGDSPK